ncbi:hypothetical protein L873DRAFT_453908 [Choiromyces venosus 120613-1]|uniref:Uncharacterized protein n=1 Tax=Choiromyces venosus 120613-1 TaxID=1336337 RepID=A0A3N4JVY2_9PEZI|nr:hypothetical protein L873DRAFT_453908 [Choiromyces venosus 120613-1]
MTKQFQELQCLQVLLRSDIDERTEEIQQLEQITVGMNGNTYPPEHEFLDVPSREDSVSPVPNGDSNYDAPGSGGANLSRITTGKSGRVIERLMSDVDRLKRELKVETTAREEERKAKEAIKSSRDSLQSTNDNLIHQTNVDKASLARKDRKIEELKAEREAEKARRLESDLSLNEHVRQSNEQLQEIKTQLSHEVAERKRATNQYEVLLQSWKHLDEGYKGRVDKLREELEELQKDRLKDMELLRRLEVTIEQQQQELEKLRSAKKRISDKYLKVIHEAEGEIEGIRTLAEVAEKETTETLTEAKDTLGQLRHVLNVQRDLRKDK